jgi:hypothetical protein
MPLHDTRGAASATGFGFGASSSQVDWSQYMIVPYDTSASSTTFTQVKFYNVVTNTTDYTVNIQSNYRSGGSKLVRIGDFLFLMYQSYGLYGALYNIKTGAIVYSGVSWGAVSTQEGDIVKFGENKIAFIQKNGTSLSVVTYSFNLSTGAATYISSMGVNVFGDSSTGYNGPQLAASCTMNSEGLFQSYSGYIPYQGVYSYGGGASTVTAWGALSLNAAGNSLSSYYQETSGINFSRPAAATGDQNSAWVCSFDNTEWMLFQNGNPSSIRYSGGGATDVTNQSACGVHATPNFLMTKYNQGASNQEILKFTNGGRTTSTYLPATPNSGQAITMQMFKGGTLVMCQDTTGTYGVPKLYKYTQATDSWSAGISPNGISTGRVNPSYSVVRVYNY